MNAEQAIKKLRLLEEQISDAEKDAARAEGKMQAALEKLTTYGVKSVEEARELLKKMRKQSESISTELVALVKELDKAWEDIG